MPKKHKNMSVCCWLSVVLIASLFSCKKNTAQNDSVQNYNMGLNTPNSFNKNQLSSEFKRYWYAGEAEISSYKLEQARYGEIREGQAVLVFVTEDFLPKIQVKADNHNDNNIPVLKLNATKNFITGIYPYSIMQSTFYPVANNRHALKVSCSIQEWCGHVYSQINNRQQFDITSHSYFEGEADQNFKLDKCILENELWTQLRIAPKSLPVGDIKVVPSFEFIRLRHIDAQPYQATATLTNNSYSINYPELKRTLTLVFNTNFPYDIISWEESFQSGFGSKAQVLTTKSTKLKSIKSAYWQKNSNKDQILRETLQLN